MARGWSQWSLVDVASMGIRVPSGIRFGFRPLAIRQRVEGICKKCPLDVKVKEVSHVKS